MELREFAEQVLFATTLDQKLQCPERIVDKNPGPPVFAPSTPGRPSALRFKQQGSSGGDFPGVHRLDHEEERGRLLHFFANHELLATELMALVLLRFPDAPAAFRRGVLQTLKDEQVHTTLYIERMRQCGIEFGELPVSGFFWKAVSRMESPMDYVARLSLTFEQANLDFAPHFAQRFSEAGDLETAHLLDRIYRDEIGHVAYGLKWFRRWKTPHESDWDAFCRHLKFPLSPQRAKGIALDVEGRRAAGFESEFIDKLNVYAQSKGRTPSVFVFNPFAEGRIAFGKSFAPVKHQTLLARDLANLPQYLCRQDDIVLVETRPSVQFLSGLKQAGFALPEFVEVNGLRIDASIGLTQRKIGRLRPWAWGPDSLELLEPLFPNVTGEQREASQRFNERIAQLYSKAWSADLLRKVLTRHEPRNTHPNTLEQNQNAPGSASAEPWLCAESEVGVAVNTLDEALQAIAAIRRRGHHKIVVKEALGLAGHNAIRLWEMELQEAQRRWMVRAMQNGRPLVVEPWLERERDFSVQLEMTAAGLKLCGYTGLINDRKGQFQANWAAPNYDRRIPSQVAGLWRVPADISGRLQHLYLQIFSILEQELRSIDYLGPISIDAFVYRTAHGGCRLKPIVEINPRCTMGRLTVELMKRTAPGSFGFFRLVNRATLHREGLGSFNSFARSLSEQSPLCLEGEPVPKISNGAVCLNDPAQAQVCLAVFQVGRKLSELELCSIS
ncbi:MAG: DUF455 family protein [Verrucomicrobia bacterium]|nr:DUF455 family protein [Verrucomicrobiota bacterium]